MDYACLALEWSNSDRVPSRLGTLRKEKLDNYVLSGVANVKNG